MLTVPDRAKAVALLATADPVLTRDADGLQRVRLLERGGDDVLRKPFAYPELRARIAAVLRRSENRRGVTNSKAGPCAASE